MRAGILPAWNRARGAAGIFRSPELFRDPKILARLKTGWHSRRLGCIFHAVSVETYLCPGCDTEVPVGSRGCPRCNPPSKRHKRRRATASRRRHGWEQEDSADGLNLPDEDNFDYDSFVAREFGGKPHKRIGIAWYWWVTATLLLGLLAMGAFRLWAAF